ncbi:hypothetical protein [Corynebacterium flavescens]|uniref:hypothetical protein n=1 Tax=Corynebacterium flavescens TaxID=28028 RepID=UPI003FD3B031
MTMHTSELSPNAHAILVVSAVSIVALFLFVETKARIPMLPMKLFSSSKFSVACAVGLILNFSFFGQLFALSLYFQNYLGFEAWKAGLALAPQAGSASGVVNCLRQIGSLLGVALLGSLVAGDEFLRGFHSVGLGASVAFVVALGVIGLMGSRRLKDVVVAKPSEEQ